MAKKIEEAWFSPEFKKVMEAIDKWKTVNSKGKSLIASFSKLDDKGIHVSDTMVLAFGSKKMCKIHLEILEEWLNEYKDDFMNW